MKVIKLLPPVNWRNFAGRWFSIKKEENNIKVKLGSLRQGTLTKGKGSVQLTSLYKQVL
jgi:hypothetical protein